MAAPANGTTSTAPTLKDTTFTKMFVGGLPYHTTDQSLRDFFSQFGAIEEAVVITDRQTGKSKGYGFVTMVDKSAAERACEDPNPIIDGRKANVNLAYLGAKPRNILPNYPYTLPAVGNPLIPGQAYGLGQIQYVLTPAGYMPVPTAAYNAQTAAASAALAANSTATATNATLTQGQILDYAGASYAAAATQLPQTNSASIDAQQTLAAVRYMNHPTAAAYYAQTTPQLIGRSATQFQQQQLQERMQ